MEDSVLEKAGLCVDLAQLENPEDAIWRIESQALTYMDLSCVDLNLRIKQAKARNDENAAHRELDANYRDAIKHAIRTPVSAQRPQWFGKVVEKVAKASTTGNGRGGNIIITGGEKMSFSVKPNPKAKSAKRPQWF